MSERAVVGKRFTIVVPKAIRRRLGLKEGQSVLLSVEGGKLLVQPLPEDPYEVLKQVVGEPYDETKDEKRAEEWLMRRAGR